MLVGLGDVAPGLLADAGRAVREVLQVEVKGGPSLDRPGYAFNKDRGQFHASSILRRLSGLSAQAKGAPVLGIMDGDLFLPDAPYVIGEADRVEGAALFSVARLGAAEPEKLRRRVQVEAVHAAGRLCGLAHCLDYRCVMFLSRDAADADRKGPGPCASCRAALALE